MLVRSERRHGGAHLRLVLDQPKANILSIAMMRELRAALAGSARSTTKLLTIEGAGDHFSYGASVEEHRADRIGEALTELHGLIRDLLAFEAPTAALVRGRCLGGGFELALACDLVFAANTALLGVPEITLGVFPPAAAALLPNRVGTSRAASAILTGDPLPADVWRGFGLIEAIAPADELLARVDAWFEAHAAPRSVVALAHAAVASRAILRRQVDAVLPELERLYLERLMRTADASEGIEAFLAKRPPRWINA